MAPLCLQEEILAWKYKDFQFSLIKERKAFKCEICYKTTGRKLQDFVDNINFTEKSAEAAVPRFCGIN